MALIDSKAESLTLNDLRVILSQEIMKIRGGDTTAANVNAITNASGKILSSVKLEMEYYRLAGKPLPAIPALLDAYAPPAAAEAPKQLKKD